ncbi:hypothetical protein C0993_008899, partial [Termitomyces sp. T159_Od127]
MVLSEFLTGKAYTFYTRNVSLNPEKWGLNKFFTELFNYCFPIDFRNQQREKLNNFTQGNRSVREYVADLDELFTIVGAESKRARVVKLFNGFRPSLRKAILREHMNPEYTSWKEMVREAEYQELVDNVDFKDPPGNGNYGKYKGEHRHQSNPMPAAQQGDPSKSRSQRSHQRAAQFRPKGVQKHGGNPRPNSPTGRSGNNGPPNKPSPYLKNGKRGNEPINNALSKEEKDELKAAGKCFQCGSMGHFARNCPNKGRAKTTTGKPPGMSAYGIRVNLNETEQLRVDSLGETMQMQIGMIGWNFDNLDPPRTLTNSKEYDSEGDSLPDLQSVSDSESEQESETKPSTHRAARDHNQNVDDFEDELRVNPPMKFKRAYPYPVEDSYEKLALLDMESQRICLGNAVCHKIEEMLESMQPYPGDPVNVLQFRGQRFKAKPVSD